MSDDDDWGVSAMEFDEPAESRAGPSGPQIARVGPRPTSLSEVFDTVPRTSCLICDILSRSQKIQKTLDDTMTVLICQRRIQDELIWDRAVAWLKRELTKLDFEPRSVASITKDSMRYHDLHNTHPDRIVSRAFGGNWEVYKIGMDTCKQAGSKGLMDKAAKELTALNGNLFKWLKEAQDAFNRADATSASFGTTSTAITTTDVGEDDEE